MEKMEQYRLFLSNKLIHESRGKKLATIWGFEEFFGVVHISATKVGIEGVAFVISLQVLWFSWDMNEQAQWTLCIK